jgi:hypothetical protein
VAATLGVMPRPFRAGGVPVFHFIQTLPINERTITTTETPRKHPGQIRKPF